MNQWTLSWSISVGSNQINVQLIIFQLSFNQSICNKCSFITSNVNVIFQQECLGFCPVAEPGCSETARKRPPENPLLLLRYIFNLHCHCEIVYETSTTPSSPPLNWKIQRYRNGIGLANLNLTVGCRTFSEETAGKRHVLIIYKNKKQPKFYL